MARKHFSTKYHNLSTPLRLVNLLTNDADRAKTTGILLQARTTVLNTVSFAYEISDFSSNKNIYIPNAPAVFEINGIDAQKILVSSNSNTDIVVMFYS
jgi:hypothetical protein